jgi:hypothetical protein
MKQDDVNFSFKLMFKQTYEGNSTRFGAISKFATAKTVDEAIGNLAKILNGSIPYQSDKDYVVGDKLLSIDLFGPSRRIVLGFEGVDETKNGVIVNWSRARYKDVNREMFAALMEHFPEQKQFFKGKELEDAMGL